MSSEDPLVQYLVLRQDLWVDKKWPLGSIVAQACHASTSIMQITREDADTQKYTSTDNLDHMYKVVLEVKGETQLRKLSDKLTAEGIVHKVWVEQPEDYPTCLATKPYRKSVVGPVLKKYPLCKALVT